MRFRPFPFARYKSINGAPGVSQSLCDNIRFRPLLRLCVFHQHSLRESLCGSNTPDTSGIETRQSYQWLRDSDEQETRQKQSLLHSEKERKFSRASEYAVQVRIVCYFPKS